MMSTSVTWYCTNMVILNDHERLSEEHILLIAPRMVSNILKNFADTEIASSPLALNVLALGRE